jgi:hypothetical protein
MKTQIQEEEEKIQVEMKIVDYYFVGENGMVIIYKVTPLDEDAILDNFYLVSFDDGSNEEPWGIGSTPETALEAAAREWGHG